MTKKRVRKTPASKIQPKRIKRDQVLFLTDLPVEILDLILSNVIGFPNTHHAAQGASISIAEAFMAPIVQCNRTIRQRCFYLIWKNCFWIKFKINSRNAIDTFGQDSDHTPVLPPILCSQIPSSIPLFEIDVGRITNDPKSTRQTRHFNDTTNTFIFPYNFDSLNRVCNYVLNLVVSRNLGCLIIRYMPRDKVPPYELIKDYIIPSITTIRGLDQVQFHLPDACKPTAIAIADMTEVMRTPSDVLRATRSALETADKYKAEGRIAEAGLKLLYSYPIVRMAAGFLPSAQDWAAGEEEDSSDVAGEYLSLGRLGRNTTGNRLRQSLHKIEYGACMAFQRFYETEKRGIGWTLTHARIFGLDSGRWIREPDFTWFGLSTSELAQLSYARAVALRVREEKDQLMFAIRYGRDWNSDRPLYSASSNHIAFPDAYLACWLDSENPLYSALRDETRVARYNRREAEEALAEKRCLTDTNSGWRGDARLIYHWGGPEVLQYLPLARKGLDSDEAG